MLTRVFLVVVVFSMFALIVVAAASNSRLLFAMARDGLLPGSRLMRRVHARTGTPVAALVVSLVVCLVLLAYGTLDGDAFVVLVGATALVPYLVYLLTLGGYLARRRRLLADGAGGFRLGRAALPVAGLAMLWLVVVVAALTLPDAFRSADYVVLGALALAGLWYVDGAAAAPAGRDGGAGPARGGDRGGGDGRMSWRNWAGNQRTDEVRAVTARDTEGVVAAVKAATRDGLRIKALGSGHSFTGIGVPDGVALAVPADPAAVRVDPATGLVTVPAGLTLRTLNPLLWAHGLALENLGDIDAQTVAGAVSTGTHGTGARHQGLAAQIRGLEMVLADGSVLSCSAHEHADVFHHARVGLGALGVLTAVTLQAVPAFRLHARESAMPLAEVLDGFDDLAAHHDHVEFYWFPHTEIAATKRNDRTDADGPRRGPVTEWVGDELMGNGAFDLVCRAGAVAPGLVPRLNQVMARQMANAEYVDRSYRVFTSPRRVRFLEMEYAVPRAALRDAVDGLRSVAARHARAVTFPVEVRVAAADDVPLSTASGRDSAYLAVHVWRGQPHEAYFSAVESVMTALGGRPALGQAAHPHRRRPARALPRLRCVRRAARPSRSRGALRQRAPRPRAGIAPCAPLSSRPPPCSSTPTPSRPTSPTWPPGGPAPGCART